MLQYKVAKKLYEEMKKKTMQNPTAYEDVYVEFLISATTYANSCVVWSLLNDDERRENDERRRTEYSDYAAGLVDIGESMKIKDMEVILPDRKAKGDFACYIMLFLALEYS